MHDLAVAILLSACGGTATRVPPPPDPVSSTPSSDPSQATNRRSPWHVEAITGMGASSAIDAWVGADGEPVVLFVGADDVSGLQLARRDSDWSPQTVLRALPRFRVSRAGDGRVLVGGSIWEASTGPEAALAFGILGPTRVESVARMETNRRWASHVAFGFAADGSGSVHACFNAEVELTATSSTPGGLFYTTNRGGAWTTVPIDEHGDDCEVAVDASGSVHLVYTVRSNDASSLRYSHRTRTGSEDLEISPNAYGARVSADGDGRVRVVYAKARGESATLESATIAGAEVTDRVAGDFLLGSWPSASFDAAWDAEGVPHAVVRTGAREPFALAYATIRDGAWTLEPIFAPSRATPDRALAIALLPNGQPLVAFRHEDSFVLVAQRAAANDCPAGRERTGELCCWPGQEARAGACVGRPRCADGWMETGDGCEALEPTVRWALRACARASLHAWSAEAHQGCRMLGESDGGVGTALEARCASADGASCFTLDNIRRGVATYEVALHAQCRGRACTPSLLTTRVRSRVASDDENERGVERLERGCELGHAESCELYAIETSDDSRARRLEDACRSGSPQACAHVAYERRNETTGDPFTRAVATLATACEANDRAACANLGVLRALGLVRGENDRSAADALVRACGELDEPPDPEVDDDLGTVDRPEERRHACTELVLLAARSNAVPRPTWRRSAAPAVLTAECGGNALACAALAEVYRRGFGVRASPARARELIEEACSVAGELVELPFACPEAAE